MDGVLVDSMPAHARALAMFCKQFGGAQDWDGDLSRFAGRGPEDIFSELLPKQMEEMGADAVVNIRYASASIMQSAAEITAYGTAVKYK